MISAYALQKGMFLLDLKTFRRVRDQVIMYIRSNNAVWAKKSVKKRTPYDKKLSPRCSWPTSGLCPDIIWMIIYTTMDYGDGHPMKA